MREKKCHKKICFIKKNIWGWNFFVMNIFFLKFFDEHFCDEKKLWWRKEIMKKKEKIVMKTQELKRWQPKCEKTSNFDKTKNVTTQQLKLLQNSKHDITQIVKQIKNSNCDNSKTQWQNSKTQIVTKLKS